MADALVYSRDAAYAVNIGNWEGITCGYLNSKSAYHPWPERDWDLFPNNYKVPIFVADHTPQADAESCANQLRSLGVPQESLVVIDMEARSDAYYVDTFYGILRPAGYKLLVYGSASTVFSNPACNGYWVANYDGNPTNYYPGQWSSLVRGKQYANDVMLGTQFDASTWKAWTVNEMWK